MPVTSSDTWLNALHVDHIMGQFDIICNIFHWFPWTFTQSGWVLASSLWDKDTIHAMEKNILVPALKKAMFVSSGGKFLSSYIWNTKDSLTISKRPHDQWSVLAILFYWFCQADYHLFHYMKKKIGLEPVSQWWWPDIFWLWHFDQQYESFFIMKTSMDEVYGPQWDLCWIINTI